MLNVPPSSNWIDAVRFPSRRRPRRSRWRPLTGAVTVAILIGLGGCGSPSDSAPDASESPQSTDDDTYGDYGYVEGLCDLLDWDLDAKWGEIDPERATSLESGHPGGYNYSLCRQYTDDVLFGFEARLANSSEQEEEMLTGGWTIDPNCAEGEITINSDWDTAHLSIHDELGLWSKISCGLFQDGNLSIAINISHNNSESEPLADDIWEQLTTELVGALAQQTRDLTQRLPLRCFARHD